MNFNATLYGQMISFAIFVWFCAKYIWPIITKALDERQAKIADGLAAADKGQQALQHAEGKALEIVRESKEQSRDIINQAQQRHDEIVDQAKDDAREEGQRILDVAQTEIEQSRQQAKEKLRAEVSVLAIAAAEQVLMKEVNKSVHEEVLSKMSASL